MPQMTRLIAVAVDRDRTSQSAFKWTVDNILSRGQTVIFLHVRLNQPLSGYSTPSGPNQMSNAYHGAVEDPDLKDLFLPFRVLCSRKDIQCYDVVLDDTDVSKAITEFVKLSAIDVLVVGSSAKGSSIFRFKSKDIPGNIMKGVPDFCTVFVINKGKISSTRAAVRPPPSILSPLRHQIMMQAKTRAHPSPDTTMPSRAAPRSSFTGQSKSCEPSPRAKQSDPTFFKSPFTHRKGPNGRSYDLSPLETDISFVGSSRRSVDVFPAFNESFDVEGAPTPPRLSGLSDIDNPVLESWHIPRKSMDVTTPSELSPSHENAKMFTSHSQSQSIDDVEAEMRRLKQELKQTMDMYSSACKEALSAREKANELQRSEEARLQEEAAMAHAGKLKTKSQTTVDHAQAAAQRIAEIEAQKRTNAPMNSGDKIREQNPLPFQACRYRRYTIEEIEVATEYFAKSRKIGEGGYGPVFKCYLDHTPAAVKVLRPDAAQGRSQFQQEVEILSCIRHPNMVLLLGACPEYGCLVYEYMSNGSLEDRLLRRGNTPPLTWQQRFRIAAEIGTGLLFLHQTKPEPLVHRDLKPANILLDRNLVSKISDVGLARLVPSSVNESVTQYRMTSTAGTFCYIDPEYQQTGMLGVKSDIYSLGVIFLQILTGKSPMGLSHHVEKAIEHGTLKEMLDPTVPDWPFEEALELARLALKCAELRKKDRPDLGKVVLPYLNKLRELADEFDSQAVLWKPQYNEVSMSKEDASYPMSTGSGSSSDGK